MYGNSPNEATIFFREYRLLPTLPALRSKVIFYPDAAKMNLTRLKKCLATTLKNSFSDSSVVIVGLASEKGGSHEALTLAELNIILPYVTKEAIQEILYNVQKKLPGALEQYYFT